MSDTPIHARMRAASYLLPDPGGEVVRGLLTEIAALKAEHERLRSDIEAERVSYAMNLRIRAFLAEVGK